MDSVSSAFRKCSAQRFNVDALIFPSGVLIPTPSALMSNRTASRSAMTRLKLFSDKAFQLSGTDLYFFEGPVFLISVVILAGVVMGGSGFTCMVPFYGLQGGLHRFQLRKFAGDFRPLGVVCCRQKNGRSVRIRCPLPSSANRARIAPSAPNVTIYR